MDRKDFHNSDKVYKKGDRVCCIGGGLHIECVVVEESKNWNDVLMMSREIKFHHQITYLHHRTLNFHSNIH